MPSRKALCFGWIDCRPNTLYARRIKLFLCPRRPGGVWSRINKECVARLTRAGSIAPAGLAKVRAAKKVGSWTRLEAVDRRTLPRDFRAVLRANKEAQQNFQAFSNSLKRIILFWIQSAWRPETRARRIEQTVRLAAKNIKANHYRQ